MSSATIALAGGVLIGAGASLLLLLNGRLAGVGGIVAGALPPSRGDWAWRVAFAAGLLGGGLLFAWLKPSVFGPSPAGLPLLAVAGWWSGWVQAWAVAAPAVMESAGSVGCRSGPWPATVTFMGTGAAVVALQRMLGGSP